MTVLNVFRLRVRDGRFLDELSRDEAVYLLEQIYMDCCRKKCYNGGYRLRDLIEEFYHD